MQCEGACKRWFHFTCCMYPDPAQLPAQWQLEKQRFHCPMCREAMAARLPPHDLEQALGLGLGPGLGLGLGFAIGSRSAHPNPDPS